MFDSPGLAEVYLKATHRGMSPIRVADYLIVTSTGRISMLKM
jgi:hypothetical protein